MEKILVNQAYLTQLKSLANDRNETSFVIHLVNHIEYEYQNLVDHESFFLHPPAIVDSEALLSLCRLKNSFANLGAERASSCLEQIQFLLENRVNCDHDIGKLWKQFRIAADLTLRQLSHLKQ